MPYIHPIIALYIPNFCPIKVIYFGEALADGLFLVFCRLALKSFDMFERITGPNKNSPYWKNAPPPHFAVSAHLNTPTSMPSASGSAHPAPTSIRPRQCRRRPAAPTQRPYTPTRYPPTPTGGRYRPGWKPLFYTMQWKWKRSIGLYAKKVTCLMLYVYII